MVTLHTGRSRVRDQEGGVRTGTGPAPLDQQAGLLGPKQGRAACARGAIGVWPGDDFAPQSALPDALLAMFVSEKQTDKDVDPRMAPTDIQLLARSC